MIAVLVVLGILVVVVLGLRGLPVRRPDPLREIARAKARAAIQAELFDQRSRLRAAKTERSAKTTMSGPRT